MRPHIRRRLEYVYSYDAFAAMGYVYTGAVYLLRPVSPITGGTRNMLGGAGLILIAIAATHHLPPIFRDRGFNARNVGLATLTAILGITCGAFLGVDEVFEDPHRDWAPLVSWAALLLLSTALMYAISGLSPRSQQAAYRYRRRRRLRRKRTAVYAEPGRIECRVDTRPLRGRPALVSTAGDRMLRLDAQAT
jgi:hypothetical protein